MERLKDTNVSITQRLQNDEIVDMTIQDCMDTGEQGQRQLLKPGPFIIFWAQFIAMVQLHVRTKLKNPMLLILPICTVLIYSLNVAFLFFQIPNEPSSARAVARVASLNAQYFTVTSNLGSFTMFTADRNQRLPGATSPDTRVHFYPWAVWLGRYAAEMPFRIMLTFLSSAIIYPICGLRSGVSYYLLYQLALILQTFANGAFGMLTSAVFANPLSGSWAAVFIFTFNYMFGGSFYTSGQVSWIILWLRYLSVSYYVSQIHYYDQFHNAVYPNSSITGNDILKANGWLNESLAISIIGLLLLSLLFSCLGIFSLWITTRQSRKI